MSQETNRFDILAHNIRHDNVLIEEIRADGIKRDDGLVDPEQYDDKPEWGVVIKAGTGRVLDNGTLIPVTVKEGDVVLFGKYSPYKLRLNGKDYLIVRDEEILTHFSE